MAKLKKNEKKEALKAVTTFYQKKIDQLITEKKWTLGEVCEQIQLGQQSRLSEIRGFQTEDYGKPLNEIILKKSVAGGIITVKEVLKKTNVTPEQTEYLIKLTMFDEPLMISEGELLLRKQKENSNERTVGEILRDYRLGVLSEKKSKIKPART